MANDDSDDTTPTIVSMPVYELPDEWPSVPDRLINRIISYLPAPKIDLLVETEPDSYSTIMNLELRGTGHNPLEVAAYLKGFADDYTAKYDRGFRFRAIVWRDEGQDKPSRRQITFRVRSPYDVDDDGARTETQPAENQRATLEERRQLQDEWVALSGAQLEHSREADRSAASNQKLVAELAREFAARGMPVAETLAVSQQVYRDGIQAKVDAADAMVQLQGAARVSPAAAAVPQAQGLLKQLLDALLPVAGPLLQAALAGAAQRSGDKDPPQRSLPAERQRPVSAPPSSAPQVVTLREPAPREEVPTATVDSVAVEHRGQPTEEPVTIKALAAELLNSIDTKEVLALVQALDDSQREALFGLGSCDTDDETARAVMSFVDSLVANPAALLAMKELLRPEQLAAFEQLATLCKARCASTHDGNADAAENPPSATG